MISAHGGAVGEVARSMGGVLAVPPVDPTQIRQYFGDIKGFRDIDELITILTSGVPVPVTASRAELDRAIQYGNHSSAIEQLPAIWEKLGDDVRREKCLVIRKAAAHEIPNLRVSPLATVVTHKVRVINDLSFEVANRAKKGGANGDTDPDAVPRCLCAEALPKFLAEIVRLRQKYPEKRILLSKTDVSDAFRNVRVDPDQAHNFCYTVGDLIVIDFRLTFGWSGSPGFWGVLAAAAEHAHCNTTLESARLLDEGKRMMAHVKVVEAWEEGKPTPVPPDAQIRPHPGGGKSDPFFTTVYVDDYLLVRAQQADDDRSALVASASIASDCVRLFGPGEDGVTPILAPKKSTDWDTSIDALGFTINSHSLRISFPREKTEAIKSLLHDHWPESRRQAKARDVLSMAGKLWNLTYVVRAGRYFVWRLLRLTGLHDAQDRKEQNHIVGLGREFHADLLFWKWAIDHELMRVGEALSAPCYAAMKRAPKRHYLSDASFEAVGGYCVERRVYWRYDLPTALTAELKRKADLHETCTITINLLELLGMVVTAWVMLELVGDTPESDGDPVLMRGDNTAAVSWVNKCGGARDKRAGLLMRMLGRLEIKGGRSHAAKHIPGVQNVLVNGISRWPCAELGSKVRELSNADDWSERPIGTQGEGIFALVLGTTSIVTEHGDMLWNLMTNAPGGA